MRKCAFSVIKCFKAITADFGLNMDNVNDISEFGQQERGVPLVNAGKLKEKNQSKRIMFTREFYKHYSSTC